MSEDTGSSSTASEIAAQFSAQEESNQTESSAQEIAGEEIKEHSSSNDDGFDRKFAALSRKDKEFRDEQAAWQAEKEELEAYRAEKAQREQEPSAPQMSLEQRLKRDPLGTLKEMNLSYDKLTELALNDGKLDSETALSIKMEDMTSEMDKKYSEKIKALEDQLAERDQKEASAREQKAVNEYKGKIESHITENAADFELISAYQANDLVFDVIEEHYNETSRVLDISDACKAVEAHLLSEYRKLDSIEKLKAKQETKPIFESPTTLSNAQSAEAPKLSDRKVTNEESKSQAAKLLRWE